MMREHPSRPGLRLRSRLKVISHPGAWYLNVGRPPSGWSVSFLFRQHPRQHPRIDYPSGGVRCPAGPSKGMIDLGIRRTARWSSMGCCRVDARCATRAIDIEGISSLLKRHRHDQISAGHGPCLESMVVPPARRCVGQVLHRRFYLPPIVEGTCPTTWVIART